MGTVREHIVRNSNHSHEDEDEIIDTERRSDRTLPSILSEASSFRPERRRGAKQLDQGNTQATHAYIHNHSLSLKHSLTLSFFLSFSLSLSLSLSSAHSSAFHSGTELHCLDIVQIDGTCESAFVKPHDTLPAL